MNKPAGLFGTRKRRIFAVLAASSVVLFARHFYVYGQDKSGFPDGYDAVLAAPDTHKVIFENASVRVLEVTVPPPGRTIPMHHQLGPASFWTGILGAGRRIFAIIAPTAVFGIPRAQKRQLIPAPGMCKG
jgi:hypothetical protein